jgi:hypothetical protein
MPMVSFTLGVYDAAWRAGDVLNCNGVALGIITALDSATPSTTLVCVVSLAIANQIDAVQSAGVKKATFRQPSSTDAAKLVRTVSWSGSTGSFSITVEDLDVSTDAGSTTTASYTYSTVGHAAYSYDSSSQQVVLTNTANRTWVTPLSNPWVIRFDDPDTPPPPGQLGYMDLQDGWQVGDFILASNGFGVISNIDVAPTPNVADIQMIVDGYLETELAKRVRLDALRGESGLSASVIKNCALTIDDSNQVVLRLVVINPDFPEATKPYGDTTIYDYPLNVSGQHFTRTLVNEALTFINDASKIYAGIAYTSLTGFTTGLFNDTAVITVASGSLAAIAGIAVGDILDTYLNSDNNVRIVGIVTAVASGVVSVRILTSSKVNDTLQSLSDRIDAINNMGHYLGSFATRAALPANISTFTGPVTVNDFVTVQVDETKSNAATRYVITAIDGSGAITWTYDFTYSLDISGKLDKLAATSPAMTGNFVQWGDNGATLAKGVAYGTVANTVAQGNDARFSLPSYKAYSLSAAPTADQLADIAQYPYVKYTFTASVTLTLAQAQSMFNGRHATIDISSSNVLQVSGGLLQLNDSDLIFSGAGYLITNGLTLVDSKLSISENASLSNNGAFNLYKGSMMTLGQVATLGLTQSAVVASGSIVVIGDSVTYSGGTGLTLFTNESGYVIATAAIAGTYAALVSNLANVCGKGAHLWLGPVLATEQDAITFSVANPNAIVFYPEA